ncbi:AAA family ATPase [Actinomyces sp. B33]|uniref:AAA family ATPase n=1 Tax=Actinomyces sp. B33 TaxID=2942131 RepID=UPI0023416357|nr:AAA family ATPase [Actinomyces sp. B33]MDC4232451.1 AAA family ATPase [Actinomyces sp. B33]
MSGSAGGAAEEGGGASASIRVARQVTDLVVHRLAAGRPIRVLGLTGPPGTGKTTVAALVAQMCGAADVEVAGVVPMDGFHLSNAVLDEWGLHERKGAPETFDARGYVALLSRLRDADPGAGATFAPDYRRDLHEPVAASIPVAPTGIVITEGNYLGLDRPGWREARDLIDLLIHIDTPVADVYRRLVARHEAFGRDRADAAHWVRTVDAANIALVDSCRDRADAVIGARGAS